MVDTELLYRSLERANDQDSTERSLLSLLHASFEDDKISFRYHKPSQVEYPKSLIDAGRFSLEGYTVERQSDDSYLVRVEASYDDLIPEEVEGADFHAPIEGSISMNLTVQCGPKTHTGEGEILVVPDWRKV